MKEIVSPLIQWFELNKRDLEWRHYSAPYPILVSEIMLQQTRVETVRPYFAKFIKELPSFEALANCDEEKLLKLWEGLGYYSRVKNLKVCATQIVQEYKGVFPKSYEEAIKLKGIGSYTCGAVLSRAYQLPYAAVDGNVLRVLSRLTASCKDILKESTKKYFKDELEKIMPKTPGLFNEALMELGATVCMPKLILCQSCPLKSYCRAYQTGTQNQYPIRTKPKEKKVFEYTALFVTDGKRYILLPKKNGVLKDMPAPFLIDSFITSIEANEYLQSLGFAVLFEQALENKTHTFTHQKWYMKGYKIFVQNLLNYKGYLPEEIQNSIGVSTCFKQFFDELF